ncbi:hypothetical protein CBER1_11029 [Cercospora berteroae]|uniref:BTB domain-containing protein n=1 Tax=Cercospora berteroae TaxID=357750 RepID=A0A2S6CJR7_9PEZI|nr:hypothetical protein CBER1_11029 [Cercospora berteroae]
MITESEQSVFEEWGDFQESSAADSPPKGDSVPEAYKVIDPRGDLVVTVGPDGDDEVSRQIRLCSRTLSRVSSVFEAMLYGGYKENKSDQSDDWSIRLAHDFPDTFDLFAQITHGLTSCVPQELSLDGIYQLTECG